MADFLAPAVVTAALQRLLQDAVEADVSGAKAVVERPDATKTGPVVNIFLYEVVPNAALRNDNLPSWRGDGSLAERPRSPIDLHYLLTFHGDDKVLEPHRLLGSVLRVLATQPVITRGLVDAVVAAAGAQPPTHPWAVDTDLGSEQELPRMSMLPLDLEQTSHLWSIFPQAAYMLSSTWQVGPVVVDSDRAPVPSRPAESPMLSVSQLRRPVIDRVEAAADPSQPLTAGTTWRLVGTQLAGDGTEVRVAGTPVPLQHASPYELRVDASPPSALRAGRVPVRIVHLAVLGDPPTPRTEVAGAQRVVRLSPRLTSVTAGTGTVTAVTDVPLRRGQQLGLRLLTPSTADVVARLDVRTPATDTTSVTVPVSGTPPGRYAVVLSVDTVDSVLEHDSSGAITGPLVEIT
jgi:hypothetical protein